MSDPNPTTQQVRRPLRIGINMTSALSEIRFKPGVSDIVITRQFGKGVVDRLIRANLVISKGTTATGRKLFVVEEREPEQQNPFSHQLSGPRPGWSRSDLNRHNTLAVACPLCKKPAGKPCISLKNGKEVRFAHADRLEDAMYALAVLAFAGNQYGS